MIYVIAPPNKRAARVVGCGCERGRMSHIDSLSPGMLTLSAVGVVAVASTIMGDFGLPLWGRIALRAVGVAAIALGLALA